MADNKIYKEEQEAVKDLQEALNNRFGKGRWMVAIWSVEEVNNTQELKYRGKWCWKFPHGDYFKSLFRLMHDMYDDLVGLEAPEQPKLELAAFLNGPKKESDAPPASISEVTSSENAPPQPSDLMEN